MLTSSNVYYYEDVDGLQDVIYLEKHKIYLLKEEQSAPSYLNIKIIIDKLLWENLIKEAVTHLPEDEYLLYIEKCFEEQTKKFLYSLMQEEE